MQKLYTLKDRLKDAVNEYSEKTTFSPTDIETIKNLLSSMVKICEYVEMEESSEYSNRGSYRGGSYRMYDGGSYDNSYDGSYARGRYAKRDSMGRYSSDDGYSRNYSRGNIMEHLEEMAQKEPDERKRREYMEFIEKMNRM